MQDAFDLDQFLPYRLNRASEAISHAFAREYKDLYGMTRPEWRSLAALGQLGRLTATEIGRHSTMHKTKVSRAVAKLADRRWLRRTDDPADGRIEHLELTPSGREAYARLAAAALAYQTQLRTSMGPDAADALDRALSAIEARIGNIRTD